MAMFLLNLPVLMILHMRKCQLISFKKVLIVSMFLCPVSVTNITEMAIFYIEMTILNKFPIEDEPVSRTGQFKKSLDRFYVTDSPLSVTNIAEMAMFYIKMTILNDFPIDDEPVSRTVQFKQSLDSFYVTDSPISVTNIAQMPMFYFN